MAPRFQYALRVLAATDGGAPALTVERSGAAAPGPSFSVELPRERWERLWAELAAIDALGLGADLVGEERRGRVGVSFNQVELRLGDRACRIDYLRSLLDEEGAEHAPHRAVIAAVKRLADERA